MATTALLTRAYPEVAASLRFVMTETPAQQIYALAAFVRSLKYWAAAMRAIP